MKIGVKTFDDPNFLKHFENKADFFEIMAIRGKNYSFLKKFSLPFVIHIEHQNFGINIADKTKQKINLGSVNHAVKIADRVNSKRLILHPGIIENKSCSIGNSLSFLDGLDKRIIMENIPFRDKGKRSLCSTPEETKEFLKETGRKLCFDVNHCIESSSFLKKDNLYFVKKFLELNPVHFHIGGQKMTKPLESHLSFKNSNFDFKDILKLYPKNAEITLETETDIEKVDYDLEFIRGIVD